MADRLTLFDLPRKPAKPRRVLGRLDDAGNNYRRYVCPACALTWTWRPDDDFEAREAANFERHGTDMSATRPCPRCNTPEVFAAHGQTPDEYEVDCG